MRFQHFFVGGVGGGGGWRHIHPESGEGCPRRMGPLRGEHWS